MLRYPITLTNPYVAVLPGAVSIHMTAAVSSLKLLHTRFPALGNFFCLIFPSPFHLTLIHPPSDGQCL